MQSPMTWILGQPALYNLNCLPKWLHLPTVIRAHISSYTHQHLTLSKNFFAIEQIKKISPCFDLHFGRNFLRKKRFLSPILGHSDLRVKNLWDLHPSQVMHREVREIVPKGHLCPFQLCCLMFRLLPSPKPLICLGPASTLPLPLTMLFAPQGKIS